ncbi:hypothetical protein PFLUV_G00241960 [Perca fluviatilis]|uniref:Uncharacterized protein n=1 Tax=Perca fluviatilis TaxID=8168 RepID=A0A6A5DPF0_PERFL|nr:hypothetical protein PFLUV_G00241960 [Perca fluviatilis]
MTGRGAVCTLTASCYVGVNTNSSFAVTGGNTEASPRLFQHNLRLGFNVGAIKVVSSIPLRLAVPCWLLLSEPLEVKR